MPRGYIAGPMRGKPQLNFPAFDRAAERGRALGHTIINPADLDREAAMVEKPGHVYDAAEIREFVARDTAALLSLRAEDGDFIALLPEWHISLGARAEYTLACWLKLDILDADTFHPMAVFHRWKPEQIVRPRLMDNYTDLCRTGTCGVD